MLIVTLLVLFLYYWWFYSYTQPPVPNPFPDQTELPPAPPPFQYKFTGRHRHLQIRANQKSWKLPALEPEYYFDRQGIFAKDECYGKPDGAKVEAAGKSLYDYVTQKELEDDIPSPDPPNPNRVYHNSKIFYYTCKNNQRDAVHACLPGSLFNTQLCEPIHACTGVDEGTQWPNLHNLAQYYTCEHGVPVLKTCPPDTFFIQNSCHTLFHCQGKPDHSVHAIDQHNYYQCHQNKAVFKKCDPPRFFNGIQCVPDTCLHQLDGPLALPKVENGPFRYSPGYTVCENEQVKETVLCHPEWDRYESEGEDLTHLPMVFDGHRCAIPSYCRNVEAAQNPDQTWVPQYEFSKHVNNWSLAPLFDSLVGYQCNGPLKQRIPIEPGYHIRGFGKRSVCETHDQKRPIPDSITKYYNCKTHEVLECPSHKFFNGHECMETIPHAHRFKNLPLFKADGLNIRNGWMNPTTYHSDRNPITCAEDEKVLNPYKQCSHVDCEMYPFLLQMTQMVIHLPDENYVCRFKDNKIVKEYRPVKTKKLHFWTQRLRPLHVQDEPPCRPGMSLQTGHFVVDSQLYATCHPEQPFVFCPSPHTKEIVQNAQGVWACMPEEHVYTQVPIPANTITRFYTSSLAKIHLQDGAQYADDEKSKTIKIYNDQPGGLAFSKATDDIVLWSNKEMYIDYNKLTTYPANAAFESGRIRSYRKDSGYILKKANFSQQFLQFHNHDPVTTIDYHFIVPNL